MKCIFNAIVLLEKTIPSGCHSIKQYFELVSHDLQDQNWDSVQNYITVDRSVERPKRLIATAERKRRKRNVYNIIYKYYCGYFSCNIVRDRSKKYFFK